MPTGAWPRVQVGQRPLGGISEPGQGGRGPKDSSSRLPPFDGVKEDMAGPAGCVKVWKQGAPCQTEWLRPPIRGLETVTPCCSEKKSSQ